jgi:hypothetical protein
MAENAIGRACAPVTPFDPAAWLGTFQAVGGHWYRWPDERIVLGVPLGAAGDATRHRAHELLDEAFADREMRTALRAHLVHVTGGSDGRD